MALVNDGISVGPFTLSAPPVIARLTSCMPQVVTPVAAAALVSVWKSSASGRWLPRWHSGSIVPGRRYLPARSIWRSAVGKKPSLPTAAILPSRIATPPSMVPPGVTIKPFLNTRSVALFAIIEAQFLFSFTFSPPPNNSDRSRCPPEVAFFVGRTLSSSRRLFAPPARPRRHPAVWFFWFSYTGHRFFPLLLCPTWFVPPTRERRLLYFLARRKTRRLLRRRAETGLRALDSFLPSRGGLR